MSGRRRAVSNALLSLAIATGLLLSPALRICVDASGTEAIEIGETDCCDGTSGLPKTVSLGEPDCIDEDLSPLALLRSFDFENLAGAAPALLGERAPSLADHRFSLPLRTVHRTDGGSLRLTVALRC